ncbi:MAG: hypothetical protein K0U61_04385 [Alphaproteobacteria bacterium]|nr:hypothetical protein [Alphaproteobacteria bacterium]
MQFAFESGDERIIRELRALFRRYPLDKRVLNDNSDEQEFRKRYQTLKLETERFRALLSSSEYEDLESDLSIAALHKNGGAADPDIPVIGGAEGRKGSAYLADLHYLLSLLLVAAESGSERFAPVKGRKRNFALENTVRRIAYIWSDEIKRPFTLDYHQGSGLTPAHEFVKTIFAKLDPEITENDVKTSMRRIVAERNSAEP